MFANGWTETTVATSLKENPGVAAPGFSLCVSLTLISFLAVAIITYARSYFKYLRIFCVYASVSGIFPGLCQRDCQIACRQAFLQAGQFIVGKTSACLYGF